MAAASAAAAAASLPVGLGSPWYAVWERHSPSEFKTEGYILLLIAVVVAVHLWGSRRNRNIAKGFIASIAPVLTKEFAVVGFTNTPNTVPTDKFDLNAAVRSNTNTEFVSYATGRQNIATMHTAINLQRRNNPITWAVEAFLSFVIDSVAPPADTITVTITPFDGAEPTKVAGSSKYDSFVWALVNKRHMRRVRDERYDLSLTRTSDWEGLPNWLAVMGESKEVGDMCLYKELKEVVQECGDFLEFLAISDMPKEKPTKFAISRPHAHVETC